MNLQSAPPWCQDIATRVMGGGVLIRAGCRTQGTWKCGGCLIICSTHEHRDKILLDMLLQALSRVNFYWLLQTKPCLFSNKKQGLETRGSNF